MKLIFKIIALLVVASLGVWLWTVCFPSPQKIIQGQLLALARDVSFSDDQNNLVKMARAQAAGNYFTLDAVVNLNAPNHPGVALAGRDEIIQAVAASRQAVTQLQIKFPDVNITVAPDKNSATADVTVDATISGEKDAFDQEVKFTFTKVDGHWLIQKVESAPNVSL